ncbi:hypothetical protein BH09PSE6_BH09PSE6_04670 [soil metagenome]
MPQYFGIASDPAPFDEVAADDGVAIDAAKARFETRFADALVQLSQRGDLDSWEAHALDHAVGHAEQGDYPAATLAVQQALLQRGERDHMDGSLAPSNIKLEHFSEQLLMIRARPAVLPVTRH